MKRALSEEQKRNKAKYARQWRLMNPERIKEHARKSREKNKEKIRVRQRAWVEANREHQVRSSREWYQANKDRIRARNWFKTFGLSPERYMAFLEKQNRQCAICFSNQPGKGEFFAVDHDHISGSVRGLLCVHCNVGLGHFRDDPTLLDRASYYIRGHLGNATRLESAAHPTY